MRMSERKRFFKDGAMLTVVALAMRSVSMLFSSFISRSVGSEGVGLFTVIMTVYSLALTFATSGISLTVTRLVAAAQDGEEKSILHSALLYSAVFGTLGIILLFSLSDVISLRILSEPRAVVPLRILSFSLIFVSLGAVFNGYFVGVKRVRANAAAQVFSQCVKVSVSIALVALFSGGDVFRSVVFLAVGISVTELLSFFLIFVLYLFDVKTNSLKKTSKTPENANNYLHIQGKNSEKSQNEKTPLLKNDNSPLRRVTSMALPLALSQYFRSLLLTAEHILIPRRLMYGGKSSAEALSSYGVLHGMALPTVLFPMSPLSSYSGLLVPEFAEAQAHGNRERMSRMTSEALSMTLSYGACTSVLMIFFAEELGYVLYGSFDSGYYIGFLAPVIPIMYLDHVTDQILKGIGEQVYSMWVNIADSCLSLLLVYILIPKMDISGYALVIIIMEGFNFLLSIVRLAHRVRIRFSPIKALLLPAAGSLLACLLSDRLFRFSGAAASPLWLFLKILFSLCVLVFLDNFIKCVLCNVHKKKKMPKK